MVFLADLFNVLEIHPVKCVRFPGTDKGLKEGKIIHLFSQMLGTSHALYFLSDIKIV